MPLPRPQGHQREVVVLPARGHHVVLGTAGSGKTTMAILRAAFLSDPELPENGPTLLVTFNKRLSAYIRTIAGKELGRGKVENYHKFARGYLNFRGLMGRNDILTGRRRSAVIQSAVQTVHQRLPQDLLLKRPLSFFEAEIQWLFKNGIKTLQDYMSQTRIGRSDARVDRGARATMWSVFEGYRQAREQAGYRYDFDELGTAVLAALLGDSSARQYKHIVIDEAQDLAPEMIRSLAAILPADGSLTFFGDVAQQIYGHRMSWRSAGLHPPKVWDFKYNYRNSEAIAALGLAVSRMPYYGDLPDMVAPEAPRAAGPKPTLVGIKPATDEARFVIDQAGRLSRTQSVAILTRSVAQAESLIRAIRPSPMDLRDEDQPWVSGPGISVGTIHSAKGLEFDAVLLPFLSSSEFPDPQHVIDFGNDDARETDGRLLYVGVTRAKSSLILTYKGRKTDMLPTDPNLYTTVEQ